VAWLVVFVDGGVAVPFLSDLFYFGVSICIQ
jgi:hypothetical protein